jgi:HEAT repeat protein
MRYPALTLLLLAISGLAPVPAAENTFAAPVATGARDEAVDADRPPPDPELALLHRKIMYGQATLAEVRKALTDPDIGALTNTVHGLYSMRWHRGVYHLIYDLWALRREKYPELQWRQFEKSPVRLALASTIIRIQPYDNNEYVNYLREHRYDAHEFHRAQVVIGLGFKAAVSDIDYVYEMADGDNAFVAQSAITALGLMDTPPAKQALIRLLEERKGDPRAKIVEEVLRRIYNWPEPQKASVTPAPEPAAAQD